MPPTCAEYTAFSYIKNSLANCEFWIIFKFALITFEARLGPCPGYILDFITSYEPVHHLRSLVGAWWIVPTIRRAYDGYLFLPILAE